MDETMLVAKYVEVMIMYVLVVAAVVAIVIAALYDVVNAKIKEARRRDQIAPPPSARAPSAPRPAGHGFHLHRNARS